ncbi:CHAD domain-containing protein [Trinickia sp. LjRoot230]|uniref:CHAD domain-containing protein n=1 Tax=Trinickia sp. LjRoot230 TaxID=3342288 RepID=UPI003ECF67DF
MFRALELVLEIKTKPTRAEKRQPRASSATSTRIARALARLPSMVRTSAREPFTVRLFERGDEAACMVLEACSGSWRVAILRGEPLLPGLMLRDVICETSLEAGALLATSDAIPLEFRQAIAGEADAELTSIGPLPLHRAAFRWDAPDGRRVDVALLDGLDPMSEDHGCPSFCELHLRAPCEGVGGGLPNDADVKPACAALLAAAHMLVDALPAFISLSDVYARALGHDGVGPVRAARIDLAGARTPHAALIAIGSNITCQWFGNACGVREGAGAEPVHQMRVALRRAKTCAKVFPRWLDETWQTRVASGLAWLGEQLGEARDLDVFVSSTLPALAASDVDASAWAAVQASAQAQRHIAHERLHAALFDRRYAQLTLGWLTWLANQRFSAGPAKHARRTLADYAAKRARRYWRRLTAKPALTSLDTAARHHRRIEAKRLRYTVEFFERVVRPRAGRKLLRQLSRIQSALGAGSDAATALRFLDRLELTPYQRGLARGWCEAVDRGAAREGERLVAKLRKPKISRGR